MAKDLLNYYYNLQEETERSLPARPCRTDFPQHISIDTEFTEEKETDYEFRRNSMSEVIVVTSERAV